MGERHLPRLSGGCHGLRWPGRMLRSRRLLGAGCLPGGIMPDNRFCFSDRGSNQSGGLERRICFGGRDPSVGAVYSQEWETELLPGDCGVW
jgi:hypothetical protein